jgi:hypothetical protein
MELSGEVKNMEFILIILLVLFIFKPSSNNSSKTRNNSNNTFSKKDDDFDPADTFYREDGLDHEMDDDGYCEECDDYHDA